MISSLKSSFENIFQTSYSDPNRPITIVELLLSYVDMINNSLLLDISRQNSPGQVVEDSRTISTSITRRKRIFSASVEFIKKFCSDSDARIFIREKYIKFIEDHVYDFIDLLDRSIILRKMLARSEVLGGGGVKVFLKQGCNALRQESSKLSLIR